MYTQEFLGTWEGAHSLVPTVLECGPNHEFSEESLQQDTGDWQQTFTGWIPSLCVTQERDRISSPSLPMRHQMALSQNKQKLVGQNRTNSELRSAESLSEGAQTLLNPGFSWFLSVSGLSASLAVQPHDLSGTSKLLKKAVTTLRDQTEH